MCSLKIIETQTVLHRLLTMILITLKALITKLPKYTPISCNELLKAMLVHSDNYAAHALSRSAGMSRLQFIQNE